MLYTEQELEAQKLDYHKRWKIAWIPAVILFLLAVALFVAGQLMRNDTLWIVTALMTVAAASWFSFRYYVSVKPSRVYISNMEYLLHGDHKIYEGILKSFSEERQTREGMLCQAVMLNIGEKNEEKDDRLLYWDSYKSFPSEWIGQRVHAESNNNMIASLKPLS